MLTGAVLAGGQSRRFGRNKALENFRGKRLIDHCLDSIRPFCDPVLVVANDLSLYLDTRATLVQDLTPDQGPLGGILTALHFSPWDWAFIKATDMPFLVPGLLNMLLESREGVDAVVPVYKDRFEPLLALYHRRCLPAISRSLEANERKAVAFYGRVRVKKVPEKAWQSVDPEGRSFWNVNTMDELNQLQWN